MVIVSLLNWNCGGSDIGLLYLNVFFIVVTMFLDGYKCLF